MHGISSHPSPVLSTSQDTLIEDIKAATNIMLGLHWMFLWVVAAMAVEHYRMPSPWICESITDHVTALGVNFGMKYM